MELKIKKLHKDAIIPTKAYFNDAAFDLYSLEDVILTTLQPVLISTGIAMEIPLGFFGSIRDRSGLGSKGVHVLGGVVDSSYRGEIKVVLVYLNGSTSPIHIADPFNTLIKPLMYRIKKGDRIAQIIIQPCALPEIIEVNELTPSDRGDKGWGSSGK